MGIEGAKRTLAPHAGDAVDRVAQRHPWETLSALSAVPFTKDRLVSVTDSVYSPTRILSLSVPSTPAKITSQLTVTKDGRPVGYDAEGLVARQTGGYWLAVEGSTSKPDLLVRLDARGQVQQEVPLPADVAAAVITNGYEGVAEVAVDHDTFAVIERDNQRGPQASIKKIYAFDVPATWTGVPTVQRRLVRTCCRRCGRTTAGFRTRSRGSRWPATDRPTRSPTTTRSTTPPARPSSCGWAVCSDAA